MHVRTAALVTVTVMAIIDVTIPMSAVREEREEDLVNFRLGRRGIRTPSPSDQHTPSKKHINFVSHKLCPLRSVAALPSIYSIEVLEDQQGKVDRNYGRGLGSLNVLLAYYSRAGGLPDRMQLIYKRAGCLLTVFRLRLLCSVKNLCAGGGRMLMKASIAPYGLHCFSLYSVDSIYTAFFPAESFKTPTFRFEHPSDLLLTSIEWIPFKKVSEVASCYDPRGTRRCPSPFLDCLCWIVPFCMYAAKLFTFTGRMHTEWLQHKRVTQITLINHHYHDVQYVSAFFHPDYSNGRSWREPFGKVFVHSIYTTNRWTTSFDVEILSGHLHHIVAFAYLK